jgi:tRNA A-37 threonylcarbamoyl transferase component Bud32
LTQLHERQLNSARLLFYGRVEDGRWAVVIQKIINSRTALDVYEEADERQKMDLIVHVCRELAQQHRKGVIQKDLHLENFLQADDQIYTLDPGQIKFYPHEAPRRKSLSQLGLLACYVPAGDAFSVETLCKEYVKIRGWNFDLSDKHLIERLSALEYNKAIRHGLKKCLRTSKRIQRIKIDGWLAVFDRSFGDESTSIDFINQIDDLMDAGQILKNGNTCYVSRLTWAGMDIVVKRYNHKSLVHSLRHTLKRSRARHGWLSAHHFGMRNIPTPKPLAYLERRKGCLIWASYLVTQYTEGPSLYHFLRDENLPPERHVEMKQQVMDLLDQLGKYRITHGDLKHTNILITKDGPTLTDLDSVRFHKCRWMYKIRSVKDRERFDWK